MRIAFFETNASEEQYLRQALSAHELSFHPEPLSENTAGLAKDCDIVSVFIYSEVTRPVIHQLSKLQLIATRSTGYDHIDVQTAEEAGISVLNVPHYGENTVAEHTFALILALSRNVHKSYARGLKKNFSIVGLKGFDLKDKTLGVIGTGRIGMHVIRIAKGFGMHVLAYDVHHDTFLSEILHFKYTSFTDVLSQSDIVTLHVPYNDETHRLIDAEMIKKFKRGSLLINTSRGGIIDTEAILHGLENDILSGVGLDVLEGEEFIKEEGQCLTKDCDAVSARMIDTNRALLERDDVVFTPHIGFYSEEALVRILETTVQNIEEWRGGKPTNRISLTTCA